MKIPVLVLFGPTASGKTAALERLFAGPRPAFPAEIVSADSMQIYRGMDVGTAKPDADLLRRLPHHLVDIRDPDEAFSVGDFVRLADAACLDIASRGRLPVVCGGTGFYLKHFVLGLPETPPTDPAIRSSVAAELASRGAEALREELRRFDPESAARIHPNDAYRLTRAIEVYRSSGRPLSAYRAAAGGSGRPGYRILAARIERGREALYRRIDARARQMFERGLPEEFGRLAAAGYGADAPGMRAIGYREFFLCPADERRNRLAEIEALVARNSRQYAKRQITFAASIPDSLPLSADEGDEALSAAIAGALEAFLADGSSNGSGY